ncbi:hypothetical protein [Campylobacter sp. CS_ED2]|nr:hypothetical protein [Campylobacter sp. CS_ED2]
MAKFYDDILKFYIELFCKFKHWRLLQICLTANSRNDNGKKFGFTK